MAAVTATIVQYRPPAGLAVVEAAELLQQNRRAVIAQLLDFAARRVIVFVPGPKRRSFRVVRTDRPVESAAEALILAAVFEEGDRAGTSVTLTRHLNSGLSSRLANAHREIAASLVDRGLVASRPWALRLLRFWDPRPLAPTPFAQSTLAHLEGLRQYISLAEADRMRALLGPDTAVERVGADGESVLVIHERLLGYAVLFGLERQWLARLTADYEEHRAAQPTLAGDAPDWVDVTLWEVMSTSADLAMADVDVTDLLSTGGDLEIAVGAADVLDGLGAFLGGL